MGSVSMVKTVGMDVCAPSPVGSQQYIVSPTSNPTPPPPRAYAVYELGTKLSLLNPNQPVISHIQHLLESVPFTHGCVFTTGEHTQPDGNTYIHTVL